MNKDAIQIQRDILNIISRISRYLYKVPDILKQSLKHSFDCLNIQSLKEDACNSLLKVLEHGQVYIVNSELFGDLLTSTLYSLVYSV